jgi:hypothetical protein
MAIPGIYRLSNEYGYIFTFPYFRKKYTMRKLMIGFICLMTLMMANAQQVKFKDIKQGTIIQLDASAQGQIYPLLLTVTSVSADELVFSYDIMGSMTGKFINSKGNFEKGVRFNWDEPIAGEERKVPDDQTLLVISRTALKELKTNKKCSFNDQTLVLKDMAAGQELTVGDTQVDIIYAESEDGSTKYWILNNDAYPVLMKLKGNPIGIDIEFKEYK